MTKSQAINYLCSLGISGDRIREVVKALGKESKADGDCISRQAALDITFDRICVTCAKPGEMIRQKIAELPSVTPTISKMEQVGDCISREAAIDALWKIKEERDSVYYTSAIHSSIDAIKQLPSVNPQEPKTDWIPISEKLPESECLLCDNEGLIFIGSYSKHYKCFEDYAENIIDDVVAWMPLPPCYELQKSERINCKSTKCENCTNHNYCDYEPQERKE